MKILLWLVVILAGVWLWRSRSAPADKAAAPKPPAAPERLDMVRCCRCGLHIPVNEAVTGQQGPYCSQDHLQQSET